MPCCRLQCFRLEQSLDDLMDTLVRVLRLDEEENNEDTGLSAAAQETLQQVMAMMEGARQLSADGVARLNKLIQEGNPVMLAAYEAYEADEVRVGFGFPFGRSLSSCDLSSLCATAGSG